MHYFIPFFSSILAIRQQLTDIRICSMRYKNWKQIGKQMALLL
jgi:hypothetical protein